MKYQDFVLESAEEYGERLELMMERIAQIAAGESDADWACFFRQAAAYQLKQHEICQMAASGRLQEMSAEEGRRLNEELYQCFAPECYEQSWMNPAYAARRMGTEIGQILSALFCFIKNNNGQVFKGAIRNLCITAELFVELHYYFENQEESLLRDIRECVRSFMNDYAEFFQENAVLSMVDPDFSPETELVMKADWSDDRYLYRYGLHIGENERRSRAMLAKMTEEEVRAMAATCTEGYRIGFEVTNKDISIKKNVQIYYPVGFERMVEGMIRNFADMGMRCLLYPFSVSVNKQMDFDHKEDDALWLDKAIVEHRIECRRNAYERNKELAPLQGGPDAIEVFGEEPFIPQNKAANVRYTEAQQKLAVYQRRNFSQMYNKYLHGEERSYSIIAFPLPAIGDRYEEIFAETVRLNTLDYMLYRRIQQTLIDVMDTADQIHIRGQKGNRTDLYVNLWKLTDPAKETIFENCVADVNIPVGEVFTSPVLEGTQGRLHVTKVFLEEYSYENLELTFEDGMIKSYSCSNFEKEEDNRRYIEENILYHHPSLPMGEFAIGTNTLAYAMGIRYGIQKKLPILIAEKTGPHFAVGDTCYSWEEDSMSYNPDGKAIVARENSVAALRHTDPDKAYFNCHTDITIPYDEIGAITVIRKDGSRQDLIRNGRFVLEGTELLNEPLEELEKEGF